MVRQRIARPDTLTARCRASMLLTFCKAIYYKDFHPAGYPVLAVPKS